MQDVFFAIGRFIQWILEFWVWAKWTIPVIFICILLFGMAFWLRTQVVLSRKSKERGDFI